MNQTTRDILTKAIPHAAPWVSEYLVSFLMGEDAQILLATKDTSALDCAVADVIFNIYLYGDHSRITIDSLNELDKHINLINERAYNKNR